MWLKTNSQMKLLSFLWQRLKEFLDAMEIHVNETHCNISLGFEQRLESFHPLTKGDVCAFIQKSAKKSCMLDPMPTSLVTDCLDVFLSVITNNDYQKEKIIAQRWCLLKCLMISASTSIIKMWHCWYFLIWVLHLTPSTMTFCWTCLNQCWASLVVPLCG